MTPAALKAEVSAQMARSIAASDAYYAHHNRVVRMQTTGRG